MMKKWFAFLLAAALLLALLIFPAGAHWSGHVGCDREGCQFVDEDGDGICDHRSDGQRPCRSGPRTRRDGCGAGCRREVAA